MTQYEKETQIGNSINAFKKAIQAQGDEPAVYNNLGLSEFEAQNFHDAVIAYSTAISKEQTEVTRNKLGP